jgi:hypothetical protein
MLRASIERGARLARALGEAAGRARGLHHDVRMIAAVSRNLVIGKEGKLPWHLPEVGGAGQGQINRGPGESGADADCVPLWNGPQDRKWFFEVTRGGVLIVGRRTYEVRSDLSLGVVREGLWGWVR